MERQFTYAYDTLDQNPWKVFLSPVPWAGTKWSVLADRHLPDGTRQHIVDGEVEPGQMFANAMLFGQDHLHTLVPETTTPEKDLPL